MSKNGEHGSVKVPEKAIRIIEQCRHHCNPAYNPYNLIFPFLQELVSLDDRYHLRQKIAFAVSRQNKRMEKIMV